VRLKHQKRHPNSPSPIQIPAALAAGDGGGSGTSEATPMGVPDTSATTVTSCTRHIHYPSIQITENPHYLMRRCLRRPIFLCFAKETLDKERRPRPRRPWTRSSTLTSRRAKIAAGDTEVACTEPAWDFCRLVARLLDKSDRAAVGMGESQFSRWGQAAQRPIGPNSHRMLSNRGTAPVRRIHPDRREWVAEECGLTLISCTPISPIPPRFPPTGAAPV